MKPNFKINSYLKNLIKENIFYFIFFILFLLLTIIILVLNLPKLQEIDLKINQNQSEIFNLKKQLTFLNKNINQDELDLYLKIINQLIPYQEDYFSIIYTLETLSQKTGFLIVSYQINLNNSTANKLKLTISGIGDKESFLDFLENYNFAGGRLATSDEIKLTEEQESEIKINLTFYNYPSSKSSNHIAFEQFKNDYEKFKKIINKVEINMIDNENKKLNEVDYPKKTNPF